MSFACESLREMFWAAVESGYTHQSISCNNAEIGTRGKLAIFLNRTSSSLQFQGAAFKSASVYSIDSMNV